MYRWLASYPKSGNTWLRMFLSAYLHGGRVDINRSGPMFCDDLDRRIYQMVSAQPITECNLTDIVHLRPAALWNQVVLRGRHLYCKTHNALTSIDGIEMIPPGISECAVYLVRDPRDVVISYAHHLGVDYDDAIGKLGSKGHLLHKEGLFHGIGTWSGHVKLWRTRDVRLRRIVMRYEDMYRTPRKAFVELLEFLGIGVDERLLLKSIKATRFRQLRAQEDTSDFRERGRNNERFFRHGRPGQGLEILTAKQIDRIESDHGEQMKECGYSCRHAASASSKRSLGKTPSASERTATSRAESTRFATSGSSRSSKGGNGKARSRTSSRPRSGRSDRRPRPAAAASAEPAE